MWPFFWNLKIFFGIFVSMIFKFHLKFAYQTWLELKFNILKVGNTELKVLLQVMHSHEKCVQEERNGQYLFTHYTLFVMESVTLG